eukprot:2760742-Prymnesium_polylepis.3
MDANLGAPGVLAKAAEDWPTHSGRKECIFARRECGTRARCCACSRGDHNCIAVPAMSGSCRKRGAHPPRASQV